MGRLKQSDLAAGDRLRRPTSLGDVAGDGVDVFCWCNRCGHNGPLSTADLIAALGRDFPVPEVGTRVRCSNCDSKDVATRPNWRGLGTVTRHAGAPVDGAANTRES